MGIGGIGIVGCLIAAALRGVLVGSGLPFVYHADEPVNFDAIQEMLRNGDPNPHFFNYPSLMFYANVPGQALVLLLKGELAPLYIQSAGNVRAPQVLALVLARVTTLLFGLAILPILLRWAHTLSLGLAARLFIAAAVAMCPLLVWHSSIVTPDMFAACFTTATLWYTTRIGTMGERRDYVFAGVFAGLAAASKYNAGLVALAIPVAHLLRYRLALKPLRELALATLASALTFAITCPFVLLDPEAIPAIVSEIEHYKNGHHGGANGNAFAFNQLWIEQNLGLAPLLAVLALSPRRLRAMLPTLLFAVAYFTLLSVQLVRFERNLMPLLPALIFLAAIGVDELACLVHTCVPRAAAAQAAAAACAAWLFAAPAERTADDLAHYDRDPGKPARLWLNRRLPRDPSRLIGLEAYVPHVDPLDRNIRKLSFAAVVPERSLAALSYLVMARSASGRYLGDPERRPRLDALNERACARETFPSEQDPAYILLRFRCD